MSFLDRIVILISILLLFVFKNTIVFQRIKHLLKITDMGLASRDFMCITFLQ